MYILYFKGQLVIQPVTVTHSGFLWVVNERKLFPGSAFEPLPVRASEMFWREHTGWGSCTNH